MATMAPWLSNRRGFSLFEAVTVVSIIGILTLIAMPRVSQALSRRDVAAARSEVSLLFLNAKAEAVRRRRPVTFLVDSARAAVSVTLPDGTVQYARAVTFTADHGVGAGPADSLTIQPNGFVLSGTPLVVRFRKGGVGDSLAVTGFGRVE
jgi:prepilin-type N-terminal cleavage/methylation domain-containing protein